MAPRRKQAWMGWGAPAMAKVAGWDFDHRLNGYITTAADKFSCDCGQEFPTPSGYRKCGSCGRAWNSYVIGSDSHGKEAALEKVIVREIPVRKDVIVASKRRRRQAAPQDYPQMKPENVMVDSPQEQENLSSFVNKTLNTARNPYDPWQREMAHRGLQWNWGQGPRGGGYEGENGEFQPASRPAPYTMNQLTYPGHERDQYINLAESKGWQESSPYHRSTPYAKELAQWRAANPHPDPSSLKSDVDDLYDARRAENPNMAFSHGEKFHNYHKTLKDQGLRYQDVKVSGGSGGFIPPDAWNPGDDLTPYVMSHRRRRASRPRTAESDCTCWEGYERVPGTKPCASGSCRKKSARQAGKHDSPFQDMYDQHHIHEDEISHAVPELEPSSYPQEPPRMRREPGPRSEMDRGRHRKSWDPDREQDAFDPRLVGASRRQGARRYVAWCRQVDRRPTPGGMRRFLTAERLVRLADRHTLRRIDLKDMEEEQPEEEMTIEHFSSRRRRAEIFDITDEGETPKGKGKKSNTPSMRKNPQDWADRRQNGQYTNRWN